MLSKVTSEYGLMVVDCSTKCLIQMNDDLDLTLSAGPQVILIRHKCLLNLR